jgi:hypothetical protein
MPKWLEDDMKKITDIKLIGDEGIDNEKQWEYTTIRLV